MIGNTGLFMDRRLSYWLSAVYYTKMLKEGLDDEAAAILASTVGKEIWDEIDIVEENVYFQFN